jgi:catechol-2,3-dioxygenase
MPNARKIIPTKMAHIVLKTKDRKRLTAWYNTVFHTTELFSNDLLTFLTYDDEHHRFAFAQLPPDFPDLDAKAVGVAHWAYSLDSVADLVATYDRLKAAGITPHLPINHGMTASCYYRDPDGNEIEFQVNLFESPEDCKAVFQSEAFKQNPIGKRFDPDVLSQQFHDGAPASVALAKAQAAVA